MTILDAHIFNSLFPLWAKCLALPHHATVTPAPFLSLYESMHIIHTGNESNQKYDGEGERAKEGEGEEEESLSPL